LGPKLPHGFPTGRGREERRRLEGNRRAARANHPERITLDLFAASVALVTRLSGNQPAGCMAEEIIAVAPLDEARALLELESTTAG
jgi:hypothetical protein